jgi:hypothetical protein
MQVTKGNEGEFFAVPPQGTDYITRLPAMGISAFHECEIPALGSSQQGVEVGPMAVGIAMTVSLSGGRRDTPATKD